MDLAFLRRAERILASRKPARLDHSMLCAALAVQRSADAAAQDALTPSTLSAPRPEDDPLTELLLAGPGWRQASAAQQGCFSRAEAGRRVNVS